MSQHPNNLSKVTIFYDMSKLRILVCGLALGAGIVSSVYMFVQDVLGKEAYIAHIERGWVNLHPAVSFTFLIIYTATTLRMIQYFKKTDG